MNITYTRKLQIITTIVCIVSTLLLTACQSSLSSEAKTALDDYYRENSWNKNVDYKIIASEKGKLPGILKGFYDEVWCVITDKPSSFSEYLTFNHFTLARTGQYWEVSGEKNKDNFLMYSCKIW